MFSKHINCEPAALTFGESLRAALEPWLDMGSEAFTSGFAVVARLLWQGKHKYRLKNKNNSDKKKITLIIKSHRAK